MMSSSALTHFFTRGSPFHSATSPALGAPLLSELVDELSATSSLQLRNLLLEERKSSPEYAAIFATTEATGADAKATDEQHNSSSHDAGSAPASAPTDAVTFRLVPEVKEVPAESTTVKVVVSLKATSEVSNPANIALVTVVDKSSSMGGSKIELVRDTVQFVAEQLGPQDALGLVTYSRKAERNLPLVLMTPAGKTLATAVNRGIRTDLWTALHDGLMMGINEHSADAAAKGGAGTIRRVRSVFLCTDAQPNVGPGDALSIVSAMRSQLSTLAADGEPVSIHTFGFGADHDPKLLQAIAEAGNGMYYYIQDDRQIPEAFGDALGGLLSVVASNVRISISPVAAGACLIGKACLKFADLFAEESREVLLELNLPAAAQPGEQQLIKVEVSFNNPGTGAVTTSSQVLQLTRSEAPPADQPRDPLVATTAARYQVAEALKGAAAASEDHKFDEAEQMLDEAWLKVDKEEAMGEAKKVYFAQLGAMKAKIKHSKRAATKREREVASWSITASSIAMYQQRSATVGLTSGVFAPAPAPAPAPAALGAAAAPNEGPAGVRMDEQHLQNSSLWASGNSMRSRITSIAADYVSKKARH